jgi:hypothetical protein
MPGLLDDAYGSLLGKPKLMPPGTNDGPFGVAGFKGWQMGPGTPGLTNADIPTPGGHNYLTDGPEGKGLLADAIRQNGPNPTPPAGMDFARGFVPPKTETRLAEGLPMTGPEPRTLASPGPAGPATPAAPGPAGGSGPSLLSPQSVAGVNPTGPAAPAFPPSRPPGLGGPPQMAGGPPMPPPRPAGLTPGGNPSLTPPPNPIIPPNIGPPPSSIASAASAPVTPAPIAPAPSAPIASAPQVPAAGAGGAAAGAAGGLGGLGSIMSGIAGIAKGIAGNKGPPPPQAKPPQITPMGNDTAKAGIMQGSQQALAGNLGGGLLSSPNLIDPRKRQQMGLA